MRDAFSSAYVAYEIFGGSKHRWSVMLTVAVALTVTLFFCQCAALAHLETLSCHILVIWADGFVHFPFGKVGSGIRTNCSLCGTKATLSFSASPV